MKKITNSGFAVIELFLVLILLAILGFTGLYVVHARNNSNKTLDAAKSTANTSTATTPKKTATATSTTAPTSKQKYLTITEWGVKIPYGTDYTFSYSLTGAYAGVTTDQLLAADTNCSAAQAALGLIQRATANDAVEEDGTTAAQAAAAGVANAHIGQYYYFYSSPQSACSDNSSTRTMQTAGQTELKALVPLTESAN